MIFVSGDRHFSELMKIPKDDVGYETLELTSSGFIQICPLKPVFGMFHNHRRWVAKAAARNFALIDVVAQNNGSVSGTISSRSADGEQFYSRNFSV